MVRLLARESCTEMKVIFKVWSFFWGGGGGGGGGDEIEGWINLG